ncbi:MAG: histidine phosphatase family protein [Campylobacterota bacterium]|nr:histidine phosphatase family protein [Campylobacterota bacterium]
MALTLLRHAPVAKALQGTYLGWSDVSIDNTLLDAYQLSTLKEKAFDICIASDLKRCGETLEALNKTFTTDSRLREVKFKSEIEQKSFADIEQLEDYDVSSLDSEASWHTYICEESQEHLHQRLKDFLSTLPTNREILLCSHAGSISAMMALLGQKVETLKYLEFRRYEL